MATKNQVAVVDGNGNTVVEIFHPTIRQHDLMRCLEKFPEIWELLTRLANAETGECGCTAHGGTRCHDCDVGDCDSCSTCPSAEARRIIASIEDKEEADALGQEEQAPGR